ncbi:MAG: choice-of-anchor D domain-containing protein [Saprospiraceae bacterium]
MYWRIYQSRTQSLTGLVSNGNCQQVTYIYGNSTPNASIVDTDGGANNLEYVRLERLNFSGATWTATDVQSYTGLTGITIVPPTTRTYYWIGGSGNWNDPTRWSLTSGGSAAGCTPTAVDNVVFDVNAFPGSNQTVTLNTTAEVNNMTWTADVNASPNFNTNSSSYTLTVNGDLTVAGNMDWNLFSSIYLRQSITLNNAMNWSQTGIVYFSGTTAGHTIDMAGKSFRTVFFDNVGNTAAGAWTLASNFTVAQGYYTRIYDATFISDGYDVDFGDYLYAQDNTPKVLDFTGTDTVRVQREWRMLNGANATLTMGNAVLLMRQPFNYNNYMYFYGGGKTYHDVVIDAERTNGSHYIYLYDHATVCRDVYFNISGNQAVYWLNSYTSRNTYVDYLSTNTGYFPTFQVGASQTMNSLRFATPYVQTQLYLNTANTIDTLELHHGMNAYFAYNQTQTLEALIADGLCTRPIDLASTSAGSQARLSDAAGTNNLELVTLRDIWAQGGATWNVTNVLSDINNTGWNYIEVSQTYYWIGGTGNWNDPAHWSLSSGGSSAGCYPIQYDNVVFDVNSFPGSNQTVTLNTAAEIKNMTWTADVNGSPNFNSISSYALTVNGDLNVAGNMDWNLSGSLTLRQSIALNNAMNWSQTGTVYFSGTTAGHTIDMAGKAFRTVFFDNTGNSATGAWTLASDYTVEQNYYTRIYDATFISNGYAVDFGYALYANGGEPKVLDFTGTDTVRVRREWSMWSGTNLTMGTAVLLLHQPDFSNSTMNFYGGGKTYQDVVINALHTSGSHSVNLFDNGTVCRDIYFNTAGNQSVYWQTGFTSRNVHVNYTNSSIYNAPSIQIYGNHTMNSLRFVSPSVQPRLYLYNSNTIDTLELYHGMDVYFGSGQTQTLEALIATGLCYRFIDIASTNAGSQATLTDAAGINNLDYVSLKDIVAAGGATWNATNVLDDGNNSGWNFTSLGAQTYYWIDGAGNWSDPNHWSLTSGGSAAGCIPSKIDNVIFDINSFPGSNQTVTLDFPAEIVNMTWTADVNASPNFIGNQTLIINGNLVVLGAMDWQLSSSLTLRQSITLNSGMNWSQSGTLYFSGTTSGNTINLAGKTLNHTVYFDNPGSSSTGAWTLASDFVIAQNYLVYFNDATFISGGFEVDFGVGLYASDNYPKVLDFTGTDTVRVVREWRMLNNNNASLTMGDAVLYMRQPSNFNNYMYFYGGGKTYNDVIIDALRTSGSHYIYLYDNNTVCRDIYFNIYGNQQLYWQDPYTSRNVYVNHLSSTTYTPYFYVYDNHTMNSMRFNCPTAQPRVYLYNSNTIDTLELHYGMDIYFGGGQTQTLEALIATGLCTNFIDIFSTSSTQARLSDAAGTNSINFVNLTRIWAQGGATWNVSNIGTNTGNTGWTVVPPTPITYYWVGGTGNWNDLNHWSLTSGGAPSGCLPTDQDDVVFDVNSFTGTGQTVYLNGNRMCRNMTWTSGVTLNPTFYCNYQLDILGDLRVLGTVNWNHYQTLYARGDFILSNSMTLNQSSYEIYFYSDSTNNLVNLGGKTLARSVYFDAKTSGSGPKWTLSGDFKMHTNYITNLYEGSFVTGGYEVDAGYEFNAYSGSDARLIDLTGTDTLRVRYRWYVSTNANTSVTAGNATILLETSVNNDLYFYGGNKTYHDVVGRHHYATSSTRSIFFYNNNTIRDLDIRFNYTGSGARQLYFYGSNDFRNADIDFYGSSQPAIYFLNGPHTFNNFVVETFGTGNVYLEAQSNNTFNTFDLPNGFDLYFYSGRTLTTSNFIPRSSCLEQSKIRGANSTTSVISQASGTVSTEWITLQNHTVQGGATFNASNTTVSGTVNGWNYIPIQPITLFWVGGTGNWNDANHWSFTSGGPGNGCIIPESKDDVVFDAASFTGAGQTVTLNTTGTCNNMIWNNVAYTPNFNGNSQLTVGGDLFINSAMTWNQNGNLYLNGSVTFFSGMTWNHTAATYLYPPAGNYTLDLAGKSFLGTVTFYGDANASWTLLSDFSSATGVTTYFRRGKFYSDGYAADFGYSLNFNYTDLKLLDFTGTDTVRVRREWYANATNTTLIMGGAVLMLETDQNEDQYFRGGNLNYNDLKVCHLYTGSNTRNIYFYGNNSVGEVSFNMIGRRDIYVNDNSTYAGFTLNMDYGNTASIPQIQVTGTNTFNSFVILSLNVQGPEISFLQNNTFGSFVSVGRNTRLRFGATKTQTFTGDVQILGTGSTPILVNSTLTGSQAILYKASGELCFDYVWIRDINATGGATYQAGVNGIDLGNNSGITFGVGCVGYYWVGDSGNWSEFGTHWATSSGGSVFHLQVPSFSDNVYFDANSFTTTGQTVNLDIVGECRNMNWLSALFSPTFTGSVADLNIFGNLLLSPFMNQNWTGSWNFTAADGFDYTINTQGKTLTDATVNADNGSSHKLASTLTVSNSIELAKGGFETQGYAVKTTEFNAVGTETRDLTLGASKVTITDGKWDVQDATGLTLDAGTSEIIVQSEGGSSDFFGGDQSYHNVRFHTLSTMTGILTGSNTFNTLTVEPGTTLSLESGSTQTTTNLVATGTCTKGLTINATTPGAPATFSQAAGTVNSSFIELEDNTATGGATFTANQSIDQGNNSGWTFVNVSDLTVTIDVTNPTCPTPNNGSVTADVTGGVMPYAYKWNTLSTLQTLNNLAQGTYSVTVTDDAGCSATASATLMQPASYNFSSSTTGDLICFEATDGEVSVSTTGALAPLMYTWSNNATTATVTGLQAGTYHVTIVDAANCRAFNSVVVSSLPDINANASITTTKCINEPVGFTAGGSGSGLMYAWDFGDSQTGSGQTTTHTYTADGAYTAMVTVTDANSCTDVVSLPLTITPELSLGGNVTDISSCAPNTCDGQVVLIPTGGLAPYQFSGTELNHGFDGTALSTTLFVIDNNSGAYVQNDELSVTGNGSWNKRIRTNQTFSRVAGKEFYFKFYHPSGGTTRIGWHGNSTGNTTNTYFDYQYALQFSGTALNIYEENNNRGNFAGSVPGGFSQNTWYEVKMVLKSSGASYFIRKMNTGSYVQIYSGSSYSETNLRLGMSVNSGTAITDDWQVTIANPATSGLCAGDYLFFTEDANGCTAEFSTTVDTTDTTLPNALCKNVTVSLDNAGEYNLQLSDVNNGTNDDCGLDEVDLDIAGTFTCNDIGEHTAVITATDLSNNVSTCSATVTVADQTAPQVTCPATTETIAVDPGAPCSITIPDYVTALVPTDNCTAGGSILEAQTIPAGNYAVTGNGQQVVVQYTATDGASPANTAICTVTITVSAPNIDVRGNGLTIADGDATPSTADHTDFGQYNGLPITRTFTIRNTGTQDFTVDAGDISITGTDPTFFDISNVTLPAVIPGPNGTLTFDVTYTPGSTPAVHTATVEIASDACHKPTYTFDILGELNCVLPGFSACPVGPVIVNTASNQCTALANYTVTATGTPAPDLIYDLSGATSGSGNGTGSGENFNLGNTTVTVTATNACGTETCMFTVTVNDNQAPVFSGCPIGNQVLNTNGNSSCELDIPTAAALGITAVDNCVSPLTINQSEMMHTGTAHGGTFTVDYTVTDGNGNTSTCTVTFEVNDNDPPVIGCPVANQVLNTNGNGSCEVSIPTAAELGITAVDNCVSPLTINQSEMMHTGTAHGGTFTVDYTVTDGNGNTSTCTVTFEVNDNDAPVISGCPVGNQQLNTNGNGSCEVSIPTAAALGITAVDNCVSPLTINQSEMMHTGTAHGGTFTVDYTVTDGHGNTSTCTVTFEVNDNDPPLISGCPIGNQVLNTNGNGSCEVSIPTAAALGITATDNCVSPLTINQSINFFTGAADGGTFTVDYTVTDGNGNTSTCTVTFEVNDDDPPVIGCPVANQVLNTNGNGACSNIPTAAALGIHGDGQLHKPADDQPKRNDAHRHGARRHVHSGLHGDGRQWQYEYLHGHLRGERQRRAGAQRLPHWQPGAEHQRQRFLRSEHPDRRGAWHHGYG